MKKEAYFQRLNQLLRKLPDEDRETILAFYREIVEDKMENGIPEEEAVASLGDVGQLAQKILLENPRRRSSNTKPLFIALGIILGILAILGACTAMGLTAYRQSHTVSVTEQILSSEDFSDSSSSSSEGFPQNQGLPASSSSVTASGRHTEEYRIFAGDADEVEIDAENKWIFFEQTEGQEVVILYETDETQFYTVKQNGRAYKLENKDRRRPNQSAAPFRITVQVPTAYTGRLEVDADNGKVEADGLQNLVSFSCEVENAEVNMTDLLVESLEIDTENGQITLENIQSDQLVEIDTENGAIRIKSCAAPLIKAETKNGAIRLESVQASQAIQVKSENGAVSFNALESPDILMKTDIGEIAGSIRGNEADYQIITNKTLGTNNLANKSDGTKKLQATTEIGRIHITFDA